MEKFSKLATFSEREGISENEILQMATDGEIMLSVWFEGLLLRSIGPETMHNVREGREVLRMATPEIQRLLAQGKCIVKLGQILFAPEILRNELLELPTDEFQGIYAKGTAAVRCLQSGGKVYRCHEMPTSEYEVFQRDPEKMRLLCEGKTIVSPVYGLQALCITDSQAKRAISLRSSKQAPTKQYTDEYLKKHPYSWEEVKEKTGLTRNTIKNYAENLEKEDPENHSSKYLFSDKDFDTIIRNRKNKGK
jgi:hypothetical protein